jgi:hypothetical protein
MNDDDRARDAAIRHTTISEIARRDLLIETLERRKRDALDFHDVSVWGVEAALIAAYEAGREAGRIAERKRRTPTHCTCPACGRDIRITPVT